MANIVVTLNSQPIEGAIVSVIGPAALGILGGYNANATTDSKGNADFPDPNGLGGEGWGSSVDVSARWTDSKTGTKYYASGEWSVTVDWANPGTGFEGWSPVPLNLELLPSSQVDPSVVATVDSNIGSSQSSAQGTNLNQQLTTLVWIAVAIVGIYLFVTLVLPALRKQKGGAP